MKGPDLVIVGGHAEFISFRRWFARQTIRKCQGMHGACEPRGIAKQAKALAALSQRTKIRILIVLDREDATLPCEELEALVRDAVISEIPAAQVAVVCPDKMVENWMLADVRSWAKGKYIRPKVAQANFEGLDGKKEIKRIFVGGFDYVETKHGVEFLNKIRPAVAASNSVSFRRFRDHL